MKNIFEGEKIRLRAVEEADWEFFHSWDLDSDTARNVYFVSFPSSAESTRQWLREEALKQGHDDVFRFQIVTLGGQLVGTINTHSCNKRNGTFSYGLAIHADHRRQGYASEAIFLILRYFFQELGYQKVNVVVYAFNEGSLRMHLRMGFQQEGRQRRMIYTEGAYHDQYMLGMTRDEFIDLHLSPGDTDKL